MMTFDGNGNVLDHTITESVICVDERMSYTGVKAFLKVRNIQKEKKIFVHYVFNERSSSNLKGKA